MSSKNVMGRIVALVFLALTIAARAAAQDVAPKFDEYLSEVAKQGRFSGAALVARDGKVVFSKGYGLANAEWDIPNTPTTKFRLGSITKQFTAASVLLLQERGKLNLQDSICRYFDNCPEAWKEVTIHHQNSSCSPNPKPSSSSKWWTRKSLSSKMTKARSRT